MKEAQNIPILYKFQKFVDIICVQRALIIIPDQV
jgi:hypothetical protein